MDLTATGANNATGIPADPTMQKVFALYPNPTATSADGIEGNLFYPSTSATNSYDATAKIDQHISDREWLSLRYAYDHFFDPNPTHSDLLPGNLGAYGEKAINEGLGAQLTSTLSNSVVNNLQFGWNHIYATFALGKQTIAALDSPGGVDSLGTAAITCWIRSPTLRAASGGRMAKPGTPGRSAIPMPSPGCTGTTPSSLGATSATWARAASTTFPRAVRSTCEGDLLFGFDAGLLANIPAAGEQTTLVDAAYAYWGVAIEDSESQFFNKAGARQPTDNKSFRQHEYDWFGQDTWKLRPNFTLNIGLRYQLNGVPYEEDGNFSNLLQDPARLPLARP